MKEGRESRPVLGPALACAIACTSTSAIAYVSAGASVYATGCVTRSANQAEGGLQRESASTVVGMASQADCRAAHAALPNAAHLNAARDLDARVFDSGLPGPIILIVGGIHGDESSGVAAAESLPDGIEIGRGALIALPRASPGAVAAGARNAPDGADMNRSFGPEVEGRSASILELATMCDLVLDLHEEGEAWFEADLPTLVVSPVAAGFAMGLLEALQAAGRPFAFTGGAPAGSLVGELGARGRSAIGVEVPARLPLGERIALHMAVIGEAARLLGSTRGCP